MSQNRRLPSPLSQAAIQGQTKKMGENLDHLGKSDRATKNFSGILKDRSI